VEGEAPGKVDIDRMRDLRKQGLARRKRRASRARSRGKKK
jgi:hypothetical protein